MGIPVLLMGESGTGKSTSMRNCVDDTNWGLVKVINKPLPFKGNIPGISTDDYKQIIQILTKSKAKSIVIDDAGYLITNYFMRNHSVKTAGNSIFNLYNTLADNFWHLIQYIANELPEDKIVFLLMHEMSDEDGVIRPKTIGKLLDEKVNVSGLFTIVLRSIHKDNKYLFVTQAADGAVGKSPIGMFSDLEIENDLKAVDTAIREYYEIGEIDTSEG